MENNLIFEESYTPEQFKAITLVNKIRVKKNPNTDKLFFTYGAKTGAVSSKGIPENPMISLVHPAGTPLDMEHIGEKGCSTFYLLHEEGQGAPTLAEF